MARNPRLRFMPVADTDGFMPSRERPVRVRARTMAADTHFEPHSHAWAQLAYCASGVIQVTAAQGGQAEGDITYIVPPSRAVWVAPGARHHITVLEAAEFRTLYIDAGATPAGWQGCRVMVVSPLLREAIHALDTPAERPLNAAREDLLSSLVLDELTHADTQALGVPLPHPQTGDKRLRALCEAVMRAPSERATLAEWAEDIGASERTVARLFKGELNLSYKQWRQQAILAHALPLLARGQSVSAVAAASGYASDSAFSAMFKAAMGQPPSHFQNKNSL
ncbi:AraC family transcriptional regulator [Polaromonas jejuensis]|uniref:AraC family transcriptional regulator n=1 Tax=Polaromonas jejuensis TaxID=457502 RepID=A0ABW0QFE6_9BURK|nr:helix-turn-helix transcriptional regulator [Polaromonas jejuensis]